MGKQEDYATPLSSITLELDEVALADELIVPEFVTFEEFSSPSSLVGDGGLTVDVDPDGFAVNAAKSPSSSMVPGHSGWWIRPLPVFRLRVWKVHLSPCGTWATSTLMQIPYGHSAWTIPILILAEGTQLNIYCADYGNKEWKASGTATVDADGVIHTDADSGVSLLTTLLLVQP